MTAAVIYDELRREMPGAPLCRICGATDLSGADACSDCWQRGLHDPTWTEAQRAHRCADCGELGPVFVRLSGGLTPLNLCGEHFAVRTGKHAVWDERCIGDIRVVDGFPVNPLGVELPELIDVMVFQSDRPVRSTHEPARIFDELAAAFDFSWPECRPLPAYLSESDGR